MNETKKMNPILLCFLCFLLGLSLIVVFRILELPFYFIDIDITIPYLPSVIIEFLAMPLIILAFILLKRQAVLKTWGKGFVNCLTAGGFLTVYCFISLYYSITEIAEDSLTFRPFSHIIFFFISMMLTGATEEFMFRGLILNILLDRFGRGTKKGTYAAVFISATIFGMMHISNVYSGVSLSGAFFQVIAATGLGLYFGAVYVRCNNIWAIAFLHGFNDFVVLIKEGATFYDQNEITTISNYSAVKFVALGVYLLISLFVMRDKKMDYIATSSSDI